MRIYIPHISPIVSRRFTILIRELKQPRRRRQQKPQKFAHSAVKNSIFARFARAFFISWNFVDVLVLSATWNDQFCSWVDNVSAWWQMFNFALCPKRRFQLNSRIVRTHFSSIMSLNNWKMIAETRRYIFRWRSRFRRRRVSLSSLILLSEIERQLVKAPLAAAISLYLISLTHPTHACVRCRMKLEIDHHTGNYMPYALCSNYTYI